MIRFVLPTLALAGGLLVLSGAAPAQAEGCPTPFWGIHCSRYLETDFGPIARATQIREDRHARYGHYAPPPRENFNPITDWMPIYEERAYSLANVASTDGNTGTFYGHTSVQTDFGPAVWGTQVVGLGSFGSAGRWGIYNLLTNTFYPEDSGWFPVR